MPSTAPMDTILGIYPEYAFVSEELKQTALEHSVIPDSSGLLPSSPGYQPTYDSFFACLIILPLLRSQPVVTTSSSEGTSVTAQPTNWDALEAYLKSQSLVARISSNSVLQSIPIPDTDYLQRNRVGGDRYGDTDTDVS